MLSSYSGSERRRFQRLRMLFSIIYRVDQPVTIRMTIGDKEVEATTLDIGEGGLAIITEYNIPIGTKLFMKFTLFRVNKEGKVNFYGPVVAGGEVRNNIFTEDKNYRLGISFIEMEEQDKAEIASFLAMAKSQ